MNNPAGHSLIFTVVALLLTGCAETAPDRAQSCCETNTTAPAASLDSPTESRYASRWLLPEERVTLQPNCSFNDQHGREMKLSELRGSPVALSFVYTRCTNERKCPAVAYALGRLETALDSASVKPRPVIALITYDPEFDTSEVLSRFAEAHGIRPGATTVLLRPDPAAKQNLFHELKVGVNYSGDTVNLHGIQLILLDKSGRHVRTYHSILWDNDAVLKDLEILAAE